MPKDGDPVPLKNEADVRYFIKNNPEMVVAIQNLNLKINLRGQLVVPFRLGCPFGNSPKCKGDLQKIKEVSNPANPKKPLGILFSPTK